MDNCYSNHNLMGGSMNKNTSANISACIMMEELGIQDDCDNDNFLRSELECIIDDIESGDSPYFMYQKSGGDYPYLNALNNKQTVQALKVLNAYRSEVQKYFEACTFIMKSMARKHKLDCPLTDFDELKAILDQPQVKAQVISHIIDPAKTSLPAQIKSFILGRTKKSLAIKRRC